MLANAKYIYALDMRTVEKRPNGWYFSKLAYHGDKHEWRGPYSSEFSVTLMIARELRHVGDSYADLGATITGPQADLNLGITTLGLTGPRGHEERRSQ
jgi:hypothetical protein